MEANNRTRFNRSGSNYLAKEKDHSKMEGSQLQAQLEGDEKQAYREAAKEAEKLKRR